jgi:methylated-DNA-[protein]-cysteine S-methyltransferase
MREKDGEPESRESDLAERAAGTLLKAADQLNRFFSGSLEHFDLPLREEKSPFRREVYSALSMTGPGETITYGDLARRLGRPGAGRAVGGALAANELLIILPCHRVVPSSGGCGSYRDGAKRKSALIALEKRHCSAEKAALGDDGASAISSLRNTASAG